MPFSSTSSASLPNVEAALRDAGWVDAPTAALELTPLTARVARVHVHYTTPSRRIDGRNPDTIVVKWSDVDGDAAKRERGAYEALAPSVAVAAPRFAPLTDSGPSPGTDALLLADVRGAGTSDLDARSVRVAVDRLARMHAAFWGRPPKALDSGSRETPDPGWANAIAAEHPEAAAAMARAEDMLANAAEPDTVATALHGDPTRGHVLVHGADLRLVGWGAARAGAGVVDIAALLGAGTASQTRTQHEWALILRYHAALQRGGVEGYSRAQCWADYQHAKARALADAVLRWGERQTEERSSAVARLAEAWIDSDAPQRVAA
ncbi:MAG: phosphotransferase [Myxococcota bacterium]